MKLYKTCVTSHKIIEISELEMNLQTNAAIFVLSKEYQTVGNEVEILQLYAPCLFLGSGYKNVSLAM